MKNYLHDFKKIFTFFKSQLKNYFVFIFSYLFKILTLLGFALCISWTVYTVQNINSLFSIVKAIFGSIYIFIYFVLFNYNLSTSEKAENFLQFINNTVFLIAMFVFIDKDLYPSLIVFLKNNRILNLIFIETNLITIWLPSIYVYANSISLFRKVSGPLETPELHNLNNLFVSLLSKINPNKFEDLKELLDKSDSIIESSETLNSKLIKMNEILEEIERNYIIDEVKKIVEDDSKSIEDLYSYIENHL